MLAVSQASAVPVPRQAAPPAPALPPQPDALPPQPDALPPQPDASSSQLSQLMSQLMHEQAEVRSLKEQLVEMKGLKVSLFDAEAAITNKDVHIRNIEEDVIRLKKEIAAATAGQVQAQAVLADCHAEAQRAAQRVESETQMLSESTRTTLVDAVRNITGALNLKYPPIGDGGGGGGGAAAAAAAAAAPARPQAEYEHGEYIEGEPGQKESKRIGSRANSRSPSRHSHRGRRAPSPSRSRSRSPSRHSHRGRRAPSPSRHSHRGRRAPSPSRSRSRSRRRARSPSRDRNHSTNTTPSRQGDRSRAAYPSQRDAIRRSSEICIYHFMNGHHLCPDGPRCRFSHDWRDYLSMNPRRIETLRNNVARARGLLIDAPNPNVPQRR